MHENVRQCSSGACLASSRPWRLGCRAFNRASALNSSSYSYSYCSYCYYSYHDFKYCYCNSCYDYAVTAFCLEAKMTRNPQGGGIRGVTCACRFLKELPSRTGQRVLYKNQQLCQIDACFRAWGLGLGVEILVPEPWVRKAFWRSHECC